MNKITTFKDLVVWQKSHELTLQVYRIVAGFPRFEEFGLSSQMRRCSSSVPSNIAEGFKRTSTRDSIYFYNIADCSLEELKYQLILARDLKYIDSDEYDRLNDLAEEVSKILYGWIKSHKQKLLSS